MSIAVCMNQLFCVGLRNDCLAYSKAGLSVWRPDNCIQTAAPNFILFHHFFPNLLPTSFLNRPRSQRSWLSHLSILNVPAWAGSIFSLNSTTVTYNPQFRLTSKTHFDRISLYWIKAQILLQYSFVCYLCCQRKVENFTIF